MMNDLLPDKSVNSTATGAERRQSLRTPLMLTAWIWRSATPDVPVSVRLLDQSEEGVGFISTVAIPDGEVFGLSLEHGGVRRTMLRVAHCEFVGDNAFRIGARALPASEGGDGASPADTRF